MGGKIKGIYKGFKYISKIFGVEEREMEIGHPTDVKHVAHIGVDHSSTTAPSWMNEFKIGSDKTAKPTDTDPSMGSQPTTDMTRNRSCMDIPNVTKKRRRRKRSASALFREITAIIENEGKESRLGSSLDFKM